MAVIEVTDHLDRVWQDAGPTDNRQVAARAPNCSDTLTTVNYRWSLCLSLTIACRAEVSLAVLSCAPSAGTSCCNRDCWRIILDDLRGSFGARRASVSGF